LRAAYREHSSYWSAVGDADGKKKGGGGKKRKEKNEKKRLFTNQVRVAGTRRRFMPMGDFNEGRKRGKREKKRRSGRKYQRKKPAKTQRIVLKRA